MRLKMSKPGDRLDCIHYRLDYQPTLKKIVVCLDCEAEWEIYEG